MNNFFASLREMFAYVNLERMNIGSIVFQYIREDIIPSLEFTIKNGILADRDKETYQKLIEEYQKYSDPRRPESRIYDQTAANIVRQNVARSRMSDDEAEDLMQELAIGFFKPLAGGKTDLMEALRKFGADKKGGPLNLNKYWMSIVDMRTKMHIRNIQRHHKEETFERREDDEGSEIDPMNSIQAPSRVDENAVMQIQRELPKYMHSKLKNQRLVDMFDVWYEIAQDKGARSVNMKRDVYPVLRDKGHAGNDSCRSESWISVEKMIAKFLIDNLGDQMTSQVQGLFGLTAGMKVSSIEVVASMEFRMRLASWVLAGIMWGKIRQ